MSTRDAKGPEGTTQRGRLVPACADMTCGGFGSLYDAERSVALRWYVRLAARQIVVIEGELHRHDVAEDVGSQAAIVVVEGTAFRHAPHDSSMAVWHDELLHFFVRRWRRQRARRIEASAAWALHGRPERLALEPDDPLPAAVHFTPEQRERILRVLASPERQALLMWLDRATYREIAQAQRVLVSTAHRRVASAIAAIRQDAFFT